LILREHGRGIFISHRAAQRNIAIVFGRSVFEAGVSPVNQFLLHYAEKRSHIYAENTSFFINVPQVAVESHGLEVCRDLLDAITAKRLDGILLISPRGPHEVEWLSATGIPLVVMSTCPGSACGVAVDFSEVVRLGMEALIRQKCSRIALLTMYGHQRNQGYFADLNAYRAALAQHHLEARPEWVWDNAPKPPEHTCGLPASNELIGYQAGVELLKKSGKLPFDGLLCTDDMALRGFLARMRELGLEPGRNLKIATQVNRNVPVLLGYDNVITQIEIDCEATVNQAFILLDQLMAGEKITSGTTLLISNNIRELPLN